MINSHPSLSTKTGQNHGDFDQLDSAFRGNSGPFPKPLDAVEKLENANPAQKRRFIKPNKTGDPKLREIQSVIGGASFADVAIALLKCRKSCPSATTKRGQKLNVQIALVLLGFAALVAVALIAVGFHRAGKAIDVLRCAREEDKK